MRGIRIGASVVLGSATHRVAAVAVAHDGTNLLLAWLSVGGVLTSNWTGKSQLLAGESLAPITSAIMAATRSGRSIQA